MGLDDEVMIRVAGFAARYALGAIPPYWGWLWCRSWRPETRFARGVRWVMLTGLVMGMAYCLGWSLLLWGAIFGFRMGW